MGDERGLTRAQFIGLLGFLVGLFLFVTGPMWRNPFELDRAIWWSYFPIPGLVAGLLWWNRTRGAQFSFLKAWLLETLTVTLTKFGLTYSIAIVAWALSGGPAKTVAPIASPFAAPHASEAREPRPSLTPTALDPAKLGGVEGVVEDGEGKPLAGVAVYIADGLGPTVFAPGRTRVEIAHDAHGFSPAFAFVEVGQEIAVFARDGRMHTLSIPGVMQVPMLASGQPRTITIDRALGLVEAKCGAHSHSGESNAHLIVLAHPFHSITDPQGRFSLSGIPFGTIELRTWQTDAPPKVARVKIAPREVTQTMLR